MRNSFLLAFREFRARVGSRSFIVMSILGPMIILAFTYALFAFGDEGKQNWNVLISDPNDIMGGKIMPSEENSIHYSFLNDYIENEEFIEGKRYQQFDAVVEINEKILSNKVSHVFYREAPSIRIQTKVQYQVERRLEEVMVDNFTSFSIQDYRKIKRPLNMVFHNVYDPHDEALNMGVWVGFFYGALIILFIALFGMTILRSVAREKSNRIVEVLMGTCSPRQLMAGKIMGVGLSAMLQFVIWTVFIGVGLYYMRETLFLDMLDPQNLNVQELALQADVSYEEQMLAAMEYNQFVDLVYSQVDFGVMLQYFVVFFIGGYLFYASFFAALGASMGTESDGQQFVLPLVFILILALYSGYYAMNYPESSLANWLHYIPFTSPVVVMVKLMQGYEPGQEYQIFLSMFVLFASAILLLLVASRIYRNGILQFGHRLRLRHLLKWLRGS